MRILINHFLLIAVSYFKLINTKVKEQKSAQIKLLKQDIKDKCVSPINPFSAFSLSNSTLIGTFATILTYLIVLIQFKAAEDEEKTKLLIDIKKMIQNIMKNSSNDTPIQ